MARRLAIVTDTREQRPLDFAPFDGVRTVVAECWPGDYTIQGVGARLFAVERKSVSDLVGTMRDGYAGFRATTPKRFDRVLLAMSGIIALGGVAFVLVEPDPGKGTAREQIERWTYRADIAPAKVLSFVETIRRAWHVPVRFADSRHHAAEIVVAAANLAQSMKSVRQRVKEINEEMEAEDVHGKI